MQSHTEATAVCRGSCKSTLKTLNLFEKHKPNRKQLKEPTQNGDAQGNVSQVLSQEKYTKTTSSLLSSYTVQMKLF